MKAVAFQTNFEDANLSDVLMDRAVMNEVRAGYLRSLRRGGARVLCKCDGVVPDTL